MWNWGDEKEMMTAPGREARIAAHRAPKIRHRDRLRGLALAVHLAAWACWKYNRRLFWTLTLVFSGMLCIVVGCASLLLGVMF